MLPIPPELQARFEERLAKRLIPNGMHGVNKKWLRYYLDFCQKYRFPPTHKESLPRFIHKLQEKKQTNAQQQQATSAIRLYHETLGAKSPSKHEPLSQPPGPERYPPLGDGENFSIHEFRAKPVQYEKSKPLVSRILPALAPARNLPQAHRSFATKRAEKEAKSPLDF